MKSRLKILVLLFVFSFGVVLSFTMATFAGDPGEPQITCEPFTRFACCVDSQERRGVWLNNQCECAGVPDYVTVNGPCNCPVDCYESGEPD